ncbi:MAG: family 16 glycosylhydrolase [Gammaproteobacteria bacterium]|nr:family 16 glycosylhydrolase [Gammaproteobacteria bacterium]MBT8112010.1 family 16 glycosylhydrolase [Gammaproteobacteria bacterium]NND47419.1 family 16 glycosylhydrolase [Woeseiaceae bacterium]NNL46710.1 family 16 glycosylhydrolase [Woeseiaceae bacterium]
MTNEKRRIVAIAFLGLVGAACGTEKGAPGERIDTATTGLVWAANVGGPAFTGMDGTKYKAEESISGGTIGTMEVVKGSQDAFLYKSYREGDIKVVRQLANGTYDITFHFAEPKDYAGGERIFDAFAEGQRIIDDLDVMASRDGRVMSALTVTVPDVVVADGELNIRFEASADQPTLSALVVRDKNRPSPAWELVWSDEFDGETLDAGKWSPNIWPPRKVNDEDQAYTGREKNLRVENGMLIIEAHKEDYEGASYTSGRVHSEGKGDFLYGRFEARAKLPRGQGTWAAIWMLPSDPYRYSTTCEPGEDWQGSSSCDAWPNSGEIDIMEHVGYQMGHVHGTVHNEAYYWVKWEQRKGRILLDDVDEAFHVYALEWTPERIDVFVDDTHYFSYINEGTGWNVWPYDHPYNLILNVAVGGAWGRSGGPIDDAIFPQKMEVDYVRVYERATTN